MNNHRKNIKNSNATEACQHMDKWHHVFYKHGKLILIEQLNIEQLNKDKNTSTSLKQRLKDRENYWIKRLKKHEHLLVPIKN